MPYRCHLPAEYGLCESDLKSWQGFRNAERKHVCLRWPVRSCNGGPTIVSKPTPRVVGPVKFAQRVVQMVGSFGSHAGPCMNFKSGRHHGARAFKGGGDR